MIHWHNLLIKKAIPIHKNISLFNYTYMEFKANEIYNQSNWGYSTENGWGSIYHNNKN